LWEVAYSQPEDRLPFLDLSSSQVDYGEGAPTRDPRTEKFASHDFSS
jgi:hypothetical protein